MPVYRVTEFKTSDMTKVVEFCESLRDDVGAERIDVVAVGDGKGLVVARYKTQELMDAATQISKQAFGKMIVAGVVKAGSVNARSGDVASSL